MKPHCFHSPSIARGYEGRKDKGVLIKKGRKTIACVPHLREDTLFLLTQS